MNELQVRLSADISALTSALNKAKATIKSFETETAKESEKGNVGFKRKIGLIEQLTLKAKNLRTALNAATNEAQVQKYNVALEETGKELARLNALGRTLGPSVGQGAIGFNKLTNSVGNANGVALEFNRIIQDAPFGLIGIGNNIQQLTANFAQLKAGGQSTGAVIKASLSALISPANLLVLGISAITAGFTAYQMGAFDFLKSNEEAAKSVKELADEIDNSISRTADESANISALRTVIEDETLSRDKRLAAVERLQAKYPEIFGNANKEKLLNGELIGSYELLTKAIIQRAEASLAEDEIPKINREKQAIDGLIKARQNQLAVQQEVIKSASTFVPQGAIFSDADIAIAKAKDLEKEIKDLEVQSKGAQINIDGFTQSIVSYQEEFVNLLEPLKEDLGSVKELSDIQFTLDKINIANSEEIKKQLEEDIKLLFADLLKDQTGAEVIDIPLDINFVPEEITQELGIIESLKAQIASISALRDVATDPTRIEAYNEQLKLLQAQMGVFTSGTDAMKVSVQDLSSAFTGLGSLIGKAFDNPGFGQFAGQFAQFVTKIIAGAFAVSKANAIAGATQSSLFTGPAAAFTLPAFIAGAIGLVASAFAGIGGGGGSRGGGGGSAPSAGSGAPPKIFTNVNTVQPPNQTSPNYSGSSIDFDNAQSRITTTVSGEDIVFVYDRYQERKRGGG